ncbi:MAG TPA: hypothetical protein PK867_19160, partial [Pirellulales bacterium]|nr:hypothetical protein [Pirellulales bacterium]
DHALRPEAVQSFYIAAGVRPVSAKPDLGAGQAEEFRGGAGATLCTHDPLLKAALIHLSRQWPLSVAFAGLLAAAQAQLDPMAAGDEAQAAPRAPDPTIRTPADAAGRLAARLLHCHTSGLVEFSLAAPPFVIEVSDRPVASPYARLRAREGGNVTNLRLETVPMGEPSRLLLRNLDGSHDRTSLGRLLADWLEKSAPPAASASERATRFVEQALRGFARSALLIG